MIWIPCEKTGESEVIDNKLDKTTEACRDLLVLH